MPLPPPAGGGRGLFIDGSVNNQLKVGCGAYLVVDESEESSSDYQDQIRIKRFSNTSSTKLELQLLLWALEQIEYPKKLLIYTDSQNIVGLESRRDLLEKNDYYSSKNKLLKNHELYREFFRMTDELNCEFVKVDGHKVGKNKDVHDQLFTLVDRASRKALRELNT